MKAYELTYIISSGLKSEEAENLKKELEVFVQEKGGVILKSEKTVPQSLAYPIKKQSSGYFVTLEFQLEEKEVKPLKEKLQKDIRILRHVILYKKPIKEMKKKRTRKPLAGLDIGATKTQESHLKTKKEGKVELGDIEKKLDEILSE